MAFKRWFRKKYIIWKYKHNWNSTKLVVLKENDRQYGLTYMLMKDCLEKGYMLFVRTELEKKRLAHEMYKCGQLGFMPVVTEQDAYEKYLLSVNDIRYGRCRGKRDLKVVVDNACNYDDVKLLHDERIQIVNGFIYVHIAA